MSIFDLLRINGRDMWQVEKPEIFQCRNGERKIWVALIPVRAGESLNVGKCDTVWAGFNAFVEYADHYSEVRGPLENRARSAALGSDFKVKARKFMIAEM